MKGVRAGFSPEEYKRSDLKAKRAVIAYLRRKGYDVTDDWAIEKRKGPDLELTNGNFVEVECKYAGWKPDGTFDYPDVHIPERKKAYLEYGTVTFLVLNHDCTYAIVVRGEHLKDEYLTEVPNRRVRSGEYFFKVPMELCMIISLT